MTDTVSHLSKMPGHRCGRRIRTNEGDLGYQAAPGPLFRINDHHSLTRSLHSSGSKSASHTGASGVKSQMPNCFDGFRVRLLISPALHAASLQQSATFCCHSSKVPNTKGEKGKARRSFPCFLHPRTHQARPVGRETSSACVLVQFRPFTDE